MSDDKATILTLRSDLALARADLARLREFAEDIKQQKSRLHQEAIDATTRAMDLEEELDRTKTVLDAVNRTQDELGEILGVGKDHGRQEILAAARKLVEELALRKSNHERTRRELKKARDWGEVSVGTLLEENEALLAEVERQKKHNLQQEKNEKIAQAARDKESANTSLRGQLHHAEAEIEALKRKLETEKLRGDNFERMAATLYNRH